jgi:hypothetical protein
MYTGDYDIRQMNGVVLGRRAQICGKDESIFFEILELVFGNRSTGRAMVVP